MAGNMMSFKNSLDALKYEKFYSRVDESSKKLRILACETADALYHLKSKLPQLDALIEVFRVIYTVPIEKIAESLDKMNAIYLDLTQKITQTNSLLIDQADLLILLEKQSVFNEEMVLMFANVVVLRDEFNQGGLK